MKAFRFPHIMHLGSSRQRMFSQVFESKVCAPIHRTVLVDLEETSEGNEDENASLFYQFQGKMSGNQEKSNLGFICSRLNVHRSHGHPQMFGLSF